MRSARTARRSSRMGWSCCARCTRRAWYSGPAGVPSCRRRRKVRPLAGQETTHMEHVDHILVVDDDGEIRRMVADYLQKNGLRATAVADGREMRAVLDTHAIDLIVLDVMMTARDDQTDRIVGLEMGADDYVTKPFATRELLARIKAVIRRTRML